MARRSMVVQRCRRRAWARKRESPRAEGEKRKSGACAGNKARTSEEDREGTAAHDGRALASRIGLGQGLVAATAVWNRGGDTAAGGRSGDDARTCGALSFAELTKGTLERWFSRFSVPTVLTTAASAFD